ncbi:MAG: hypothetical protein HQL87_01055 [Magnetococcales bacterium]|nr:hypothetical protein [Magnetococcales bacterium]
MTPHPPRWECRWPDLVALQVATARLLRDRTTDPSLNPRLGIRVQRDPSDHPQAPIRALLVTPWAVERVYWNNPARQNPPVRHTIPLLADAHGRVAAGIGVILEYRATDIPVRTAWEPETGHYFVETLLPAVQDLGSVEEAIAVALGRKPLYLPKQSLTDHLSLPVNRRHLLGLWHR